MARNPILTGSSRRARRRGLKSWQTRQNFAFAVAAAVDEIAALPASELSRDERENWRIAGEAADGGAVVVWTFSRFYAHMSEWTRRDVRNPAFCVMPGDGLENALADMLRRGSTVYTAKAKFYLIEGNESYV